jgi:hypothetical protein
MLNKQKEELLQKIKQRHQRYLESLKFKKDEKNESKRTNPPASKNN